MIDRMVLGVGERLAFAENRIALEHDSVWMSTRAAAALSEVNPAAPPLHGSSWLRYPWTR